MDFIKKRFVWAALYTVLLVSFTLYTVLDTFVITRVYTAVPPGESVSDSSAAERVESETESNDTSQRIDVPSNESGSSSSAAENVETGTEQESTSRFTESAVTSESSYSDPNISIMLTEYREYNTSIYVADIYISSVEYLQTAFAQNAYGRNITEKTSEIAETNHAILAINGDYYGSQIKGYVLKNGLLYRESVSGGQEDLVIGKDGSFEIVAEDEVSAEALLEGGALQVLSFGPGLIEEGAVSVTENDEVGKAKASNPRTAVGMAGDLHYFFVVSDGRTDESEGLTLYQLATFMKSLGAHTAYNLDGGGSSTMYFNGAVINNPTSSGRSIKERAVSDIVYIGY